MDEEPDRRSQNSLPWQTLFAYFALIGASAIVATSFVRFGNGTVLIAVLVILTTFLLRKEFT